MDTEGGSLGSMASRPLADAWTAKRTGTEMPREFHLVDSPVQDRRP